MAGDGKDPETKKPQTENANTETRTKGTGEGGRGGSQKPPRSQNLFAADFLNVVHLADINVSRRRLGLREETIGYN